MTEWYCEKKRLDFSHEQKKKKEKERECLINYLQWFLCMS